MSLADEVGNYLHEVADIHFGFAQDGLDVDPDLARLLREVVGNGAVRPFAELAGHVECALGMADEDGMIVAAGGRGDRGRVDQAFHRCGSPGTNVFWGRSESDQRHIANRQRRI
jgi:hypothetical protein